MTYPLVSWQVTVPAFTIGVSVNGGAAETLTVPAGEYWGWRTTGVVTTGGRDGSVDSLASVFAFVLRTHSGISTAIGVYGGSGGSAGWLLRFVSGSGGVTDITITTTSNAAALRLFGITAPFAIRAASTNTLIVTRTAGVWRPFDIAATRVEPVYTAVGTGAWSPYDASANDRIQVGGTLGWAVQWPYVNASDITREINGLADYLPLASRLPGDTNGTLDDLIAAAASGRDLLLALPPIGTAAVDYRTCIIPRAQSLVRDEFTAEAGVGSRRYNVTIPFLETRSYAP